MNTHKNSEIYDNKKYRLLYLIRCTYPYNKMTIQSAIEELSKKIGCSERAFRDWTYRKKGNPVDIPYRYMSALSSFFNIKIGELINDKP